MAQVALFFSGFVINYGKAYNLVPDCYVARDLHTIGDLTEVGILAGQPIAVFGTDKELTIITNPYISASGYSQTTQFERHVVKFCWHLAAAGSGALWISSLDYPIFHPMKG